LATAPSLTSRRAPEPQREDGTLVLLAVVLSVLLHLALVLLVRLVPAAPVVLAAEREVTRAVTFADDPVHPSDEPPSDAENVASANARAESPEPEPPPEDALRDVPYSRPRPVAPSTPPPPAASRAESEADEAVEEEGVGIEPRDEKRERLDDVLRGLRTPSRPWAEAVEGAGELPSSWGREFGGSDLQFESRADVDWGPYAARIKRIVRSNWRIPIAAQMAIDGITQLHFCIERDGGVRDLEVVRESGTPPLDVAARDAIALSDAFPPPPLPVDIDEECVGVRWTFLYNIDDREYRQWEREERLRARQR
jgi:protein TonB